MRKFIFATVLLIEFSNIVRPMNEAISQGPNFGLPLVPKLSSLRDRYRPLLVFAPSDTDSRFSTQVRMLSNRGVEMHERQVLFVPLLLRSVGTPQRMSPDGADTMGFPQDEADMARRRFHIYPGDFTVILIGKDGSEKFRTHSPVTIERLNEVIDAMPMRQQEVRNGNSK